MTASPSTTSPRRSCGRCAGTTRSRRASSSSPRRSGSGSTRSASTLPPERELAARLKVSRATLREAMAALRQAGLVETTPRPRRRHGGDPQAADARRPGPRRGRRRSGGGTGWTRSTSAASSSRARRTWRRARTSPRQPGPSSSEAHARRRRGPQAGPAPAGRLPLPPDRGRADRVAARRRGGDLGAGDAARDAAGDPGAGGQHRPLRPPARRARARDPRGQGRPGAAG